MKIRAQVTITGLVQGVNFRYYTAEHADRHNVKGWITNLGNGDVMGCFEGEETDVKTLIDWCRRGPSRSLVEKLSVEIQEYTGEFTDFRIRR